MCSLFLQLQEAAHSQLSCWGTSTTLASAGKVAQQRGRPLECIEENFLGQVIERPTREDAILDLMITSVSELLSDVKIGDSLGCNDHMLEDAKNNKKGF